MSSEQFKNRLVRRLTTPPEIVYALTRHWLVLFACVFVGTVFMTAKVMTDPPVYEGAASLLITTGDPLISELGQAAMPYRLSRDEWRAFFNSRVDILQSDSVLGEVVDALESDRILAQSDNPEAAQYEGWRRTAQTIRDRLKGFLDYLKHPDLDDFSPGSLKQKAVYAFRERSAVIPNFKNGSVGLKLYGIDRAQVRQELETWIKEYTDYLVTMLMETAHTFVRERLAFWKNQEDTAKNALSEYEARAYKELPGAPGESTEISEQARELLFQQATQLQVQYYNLQDRLLRDPSDPSSPAAIPGISKERADLLAEEARLEAAIREALAFHPEDSVQVKALKFQLSEVQKKLGLQDETEKPVENKEPAEITETERRIRERMAALDKQIKALRGRHAAMGRALERVKELKDEVARAQRERMRYEGAIFMQGRQSGMREHIQVQVSDKPHVGWMPYNTYPQRQVLFGSLGGLLLGALVALLLEALQTKVRFRNDIVGEFGVSVVGVIPRK